MMMPSHIWLAPYIPGAGRLYPHPPLTPPSTLSGLGGGLAGLGLANPGIADLIRRTAAAYGVDPELAYQVAYHESRLSQSAVSSAGAIGVFQLMPATAASLGVDPYDLTQNVQGGVIYLAQMLQRYNGDVGSALAAYNEGPGAYDSGHFYPETSAYVTSILADYSTSHVYSDSPASGSSSPSPVLNASASAPSPSYVPPAPDPTYDYTPDPSTPSAPADPGPGSPTGPSPTTLALGLLAGAALLYTMA